MSTLGAEKSTSISVNRSLNIAVKLSRTVRQSEILTLESVTVALDGKKKSIYQILQHLQTLQKLLMRFVENFSWFPISIPSSIVLPFIVSDSQRNAFRVISSLSEEPSTVNVASITSVEGYFILIELSEVVPSRVIALLMNHFRLKIFI